MIISDPAPFLIVMIITIIKQEGALEMFMSFLSVMKAITSKCFLAASKKSSFSFISWSCLETLCNKSLGSLEPEK